MTLPRNIIILLVIILLSIYAYSFLVDFNSFRNFVNREYLTFKNFVFSLYNVKSYEKVALTEDFIRKVSKDLGIDIKELIYEEGKYRLKIKSVPFGRLMLFLERISKGGEVVSAKLIDNTGKGVFEAELTLRPF